MALSHLCSPRHSLSPYLSLTTEVDVHKLPVLANLAEIPSSVYTLFIQERSVVTDYQLY